MAAICAFQTSDDFTAGSLHIACSPLQCLNAWLFIHADHQGIVRRIQVESDYIGSFCSKLFVSTDTPRTLPLKTNTFFAKHSPHRVFGALDNFGHRGSVPHGLAFRRWALQDAEHLVAKIGAIFLLGSRPGRICKACDTVDGKSVSPFYDGIRSGLTFLRDILDLFAGQTEQNNPGSFDHLSRFGSTDGQPLENLPFFFATGNLKRFS